MILVEKPNTKEPPGNVPPSLSPAPARGLLQCPEGRVKGASALRDNLQQPWPIWPRPGVAVSEVHVVSPAARARSTLFSTALGDTAGAQLGNAAAIYNLHYLCSEEGGHKYLSLLSHSLLVNSLKEPSTQGRGPGRRRRGSWLGAGCSRGGGARGAGQGPCGPQGRCLPSPDSTHFSQPRKHNEPGRSAHPYRRFKVATCLQLPLSPAGWEKRPPKTWKRGDVLSRE